MRSDKTVWSVGDIHPDAPWTKSGIVIRCDVCGEQSRQSLGVSSIHWVDGHMYARCTGHA